MKNTRSVKRGDTIELLIGPITDDQGTVQDITGSTLRFTAKDRLEDLDVDAVIVGSTADGRITITDGPGGKALVAIPGSATAGFTEDRALVCDVQLSQPNGYTRTLWEATLLVTRDVTRAT